MARPKIIISNTERDKNGNWKVMAEGWTVQIGRQSKTFSKVGWVKDGIGWVNEQLRKPR